MKFLKKDIFFKFCNLSKIDKLIRSTKFKKKVNNKIKINLFYLKIIIIY